MPYNSHLLEDKLHRYGVLYELLLRLKIKQPLLDHEASGCSSTVVSDVQRVGVLVRLDLSLYLRR